MSPMILLVGTCLTLTDDKISTKSLLGCSSIDEMKKKPKKKGKKKLAWDRKDYFNFQF